MSTARLLLGAALACATAACTVQEAPTELSEINRFLYREWGNEDEQMLVGAVANFETFMAGVPTEGSLSERSFVPANLTEVDVQDHARPDRPLENLLGVSLLRLSLWSSAQHALLIVLEDQTPVQGTAPIYQRTFTGESDPQCFLSRECLVLTTVNEIRRENLLISVDFTAFKDYRWIRLDSSEEQDERWAILARSWFEESWAADDEDSTLWQSHTMDLWVDQPGGGLLRYESMWAETEIPGVTDPDIIAGTIRISLDDTFEDEDSHIEELLAGR